MSKARLSLGRFQGPRIVQPIIKGKANSPILSSSPRSSLGPGSNPFSQSSATSESVESMDLEATNTNEIIKTHQMIQIPTSDLAENRPLFHSVSSLIFDLNEMLYFEVHPLLSESAPEDLRDLLKDKCSQCLQVCDFTNDDETFQEKEKNEKSQILTDILNCVSDPNKVQLLSEHEYQQIYHMFRRNVIRTPPPPPDVWFAPVSIDFTLDRIEERGWSHLSLFYDIITAFISNRKFNPSFCPAEQKKLLKGVISMFQSPDAREREKDVKLFHAIYRANKKIRTACRDQVSTFLSAAIYSPTPRLGVADMLTAFVPIIAGFKVPVHQDNLQFFVKVLLPLHCSSHLHMFHTQLVNVVTTFLSKTDRLVGTVYSIIFKHWPVTSPTKQILFLNEMELLAKLLQPSDIEIIKKLCHIVASCSSSQLFTVAERSLMLWESDSFMSLVGKTSKETFPILIPDIFKTATSHWCPDVRNLALNALRVLKGFDLQSFENYGTSFKIIESQKIMVEMSKGKMWDNLIEMFYQEESSQKAKSKHYTNYLIKNQLEAESKREIIRKIFIGCESLNKTIETTVPERNSLSQPAITTNEPKIPQPKLTISPRERFAKFSNATSPHRAATQLYNKK